MLLQRFSSFYGPELTEIGTGEATHFLSLTHWIEARKFDLSKHASLVQELLLMPTEYEVRRLSRKESANWRSDWQLIKTAVIMQGVAYHCIDLYPSRPIKSQLVREIERCGISKAVADILCERGMKMAAAPKVCVLAENKVPIVHLNRRLRLINKRFEGFWSLVHWRGRFSNKTIHDWALSSGLPIIYVGDIDQRTLGPGSEVLRDCADHYYVFDRKGDKRAERTVANVRSAGKEVEVVLWQPEQMDDMFI